MPGPAIHHIIAEEFKNRIISGTIELYNTREANESLRVLLAKKENLPYYYLGCQGPDFLFFNTRDWLGYQTDLPEFFMSVLETMDEVKKTVKDTIRKPIDEELKKIEEKMNNRRIREVRELLDTLSVKLGAFSLTGIEFIKSVTLTGLIFETPLLTHPYGDGVKTKEAWWWFDILHYRKTGQYVKHLFDLTQNDPDPRLRLYALGYLTHYAGDTVGHPYVNMISGGAYRSYPQRHKTCENFQDVYNFQELLAEGLAFTTGRDFNDSITDFTSSNLHAFYNFNFNGEINTDDDNSNDHIPDPTTSLPDNLASKIVEAIHKTYSDPLEIGKGITAGDIELAYQGYYKYLKSSTTLGLNLPAPVPFELTQELVNLWERAKEKIGAISNILENKHSIDSELSIINLFETISEIILATIAAAVAMVEVVKDWLDSGIMVASKVLMGALSLIYDLIYDIFQNMRLIIALNGFAFPMLQHIGHPLFNQFKRPANADQFGTDCGDIINELPYQRIPSSGLIDTIATLSKHLVYPNNFAIPEKSHLGTQSILKYIDENSLFYAYRYEEMRIENINILLEQIIELQGRDTYEEEINLKYDDKITLGSAVQLTEACFKRMLRGEKIPDFNLDGDRGYGSLCWTQMGNDPSFPSKLVVNSEDKVSVTVIKS